MSIYFSNDDLAIFARNNVAVIEFRASKTKNAIHFAMANELSKCLGRNGATPGFLNWLLENNCGALALQSAIDKTFVSGGDVKELAGTTENIASDYADRMRDACIGLTKIDLPTVTLLAGGAFGGGAELALATDFRFITPQAALHFWQTQWGVPGGWNGMARLNELTALSPRKIGLWFACAASLDAADLLRFGLADAQYPSASEGFAAIEALAMRFLACEKTLRDALLRRGHGSKPLAESDVGLFESFWMGPTHKTKLAEYKNRRSKS